MENIVNVEGTELDVREYNGQMVVTFDDIDLVHKRPSGTARKAFNRNKKRFINGVDYIVLEKENSNVHRVDIRNIDIPNRGITVFTESGYLMLVKPFKDDLSWKVQRSLVNAYFALRNQHPAPTSTPCTVVTVSAISWNNRHGKGSIVTLKHNFYLHIRFFILNLARI